MKRRTNLFYTGNDTDIDESNFLTFSNYTEHLTGVSLATEFKMFPSRFLCLNIPKLKEGGLAAKQDFIKNYLVAYYENKLTFLRDIFVDQSESEKTGDIKSYPDRMIRYLGYLIDAILKFDPETKLVYQSEITEQDYNGTFTDIICTIDSSETFNKKYDLYKVSNYEDGAIKIGEDNEDYEMNSTYLYGWSIKVDTNEKLRWIGPSNFMNTKPKDDKESEDLNIIQYNLHAIHNVTYSSQSEDSNIEFNVIIPLYDIVHFDPATNKIILETDEEGNDILETDENPYSTFIRENASLEYFNLDYVPANDEHAINVPYGIWFANESIILKRSNFKQYAPSWSLLIGTQFKPFPNSEYLYADVNSGSKMAGFATFSQILSRQNEILNGLLEYKQTINNLQNQVETQLAYISAYTGKIASLENELNDLRIKFESHKNDMTIHTKKDNVHQWIAGR